MTQGKIIKIIMILPGLLGGLLGLLAPWFVLGYWTRWLFFPNPQRLLFILVISLISIAVFSFFSIQIWKRITSGGLRTKELLIFLLIFGVSLAVSLVFRADLPFALSNPFRVYEISITKITQPELTYQKPISFSLQSSYGKSIFIPSLKWQGGWVSSGDRISHHAEDTLPLTYRFLENRISDRFYLLIYKSPESGRAEVITPDQTLQLDFFANTNSTQTISLDIKAIRKPAMFFMIIELLTQVLIFTIFSAFFVFFISAGINWLGEISYWCITKCSRLFTFGFTGLKSWKLTTLAYIILIAGGLVFLLRSSILIFTYNCLLLGAFALLTTSLFNVRNTIAYFIALNLLAFSNLVLIVEIAGGLAILNANGITLIQLILTIASWIVWMRAGKPSLFGPIQNMSGKSFRQILLDATGEHKEVALLFLATLLTHSITFLKIIFVPQNYDDILTAYYSRVGYWMQNQSLYPWNTSTYNLSQIVYPLNGQIPLTWSASLLHSNALGGFLQWIFLPIGILSIYGIARFYSLKRWQAFLGALIFALFPNVIMQSSSALTDLLIACLLVSTLYLFMCGLRDENKGLLTLSAIGMGLTVGVKQTAIFLLPGLAIFMFFTFLDMKKKSIALLIRWIFKASVSVLLLGAYIYIMNFINFGNFGGTRDIVEKNFSQLGLFSNPSSLISLAGSNLYQLILSSFFDNFFVDFFHPHFAAIYQHIPTSSPIYNYFPMNRYLLGISWIGQVGFILFCAVLVKLLIKAVKERRWAFWGIFAVVIPFTVSFLILKSNVVAMSRYLLLVVIVIMPFVPFVLNNKIIRQWAIVLSIILAGVTLVTEGFKPLRGENAIWKLSYSEKATMRFPELRPLLNDINRLVPEDATMGIILPSKFPQALLFTPDFSRKIIQIEPTPQEVRLNDLRNDGIEFLLVEKKLITDGLKLPPELKELFNSGEAPVLFAVP